MKNLKLLSATELDQNLKSLFLKEREVLCDLVLHVQEVDRRRLYLEFGFSSLFDYMTRHHSYPHGSAQRLLDAARLSLEVPSLVQDIEKGEINISQISLVQKSLRESNRVNHKKVSVERKLELIECIKQKSFFESQSIVAKSLDLKVKEKPKVSAQADGSVRLEVTLSKEQWEKVEKMRDLLSHSLPGGSWDEVLEHLADRVIKSKTQMREANKKVEAKNPEQRIPVRKNPESIRPSFYRLRKAVLARDKCCQAKHAKTGKLCATTWQLQVDHLKPRWAGGEDTLENLQALCAQHNREKYRRQAQIRRI